MVHLLSCSTKFNETESTEETPAKANNFADIPPETMLVCVCITIHMYACIHVCVCVCVVI
jgi:hypothetical protein